MGILQMFGHENWKLKNCQIIYHDVNIDICIKLNGI